MAYMIGAGTVPRITRGHRDRVVGMPSGARCVSLSGDTMGSFLSGILGAAVLFVAYGLLLMRSTRRAAECGSCALAKACASRGTLGIDERPGPGGAPPDGGPPRTGCCG